MIHLLTPDRGDRAPLFSHCRRQVSLFEQNGHKIKHWLLNEAPRTDKPDLTARIQRGYNLVKEEGNESDWIFIVENDDNYPADYLTRFMPYFADYDFIGSDRTIYYNVRNRTWEQSHHPNHSSLFCTAFRVSAMANFKWHLAHPVFLDLDIWKYARRFRRKFIDTGAIGIKGHGLGLCGGKGHVQRFNNKDPDMSWLQHHVDPVSFELYSRLKVHPDA